MATDGARVCAQMLREQGTFLQQSEDIYRLTELMASIGYEVAIAPLEEMADPESAAHPSPVMPELVVRRRAASVPQASGSQKEAKESVAVQYIRPSMCFRCDSCSVCILLWWCCSPVTLVSMFLVCGVSHIAF
jgi:hypothetical protein